MANDHASVQEMTRADIFIQQLRTHTADSHNRLEALPVSKSVTSPNITKASYTRYLQLMGAVIQQTESTLFPMLAEVIPDIAERQKIPWIAADLDFLGAAQQAYPSPFSLEIDSVAFAFGMMYVVEGSVLGGRYILKNIQQNLGYQEEGVRYFSGYGNKTGGLWKQFLNALTAFEAQHGHGDEIISGADYAFTAIYDHLKKHSGDED
ncbi:heme oxygenase [Flavobacterium magnum]|uniref:Heme oxygenase n=1 Tax=Flavobacterium magnum TaxID=2162713 RepID=A0A2S0RF81_9FLAO|nr:biliverdin-producing heme oxygenase [Flavobacterium magnum]AWA29751.1 heme oxygenase [Flavobacterium magnum]